MARSLHFKLSWPFLHRAARTAYQRFARKEPTGRLNGHFCIPPYEEFING